MYVQNQSKLVLVLRNAMELELLVLSERKNRKSWNLRQISKYAITAGHPSEK